MDHFLQQFYDRKLWWVWAGIAVTHVLAIFTQHSIWAIVPLAMIGVGVFFISLRSMTFGLALALLEIFTGGHGHLLSVEIAGFQVGIRMVMFAAVMAAWCVALVRRQLVWRFVAQRDMPWAFLFVAVLLGTAIGFLNNSTSEAFDDANGYIAIGYLLPFITLVWTPERKRVLLQMFFAAAAWVAASTLALWYAFTHLPGVAAGHVYRFVRDARLAEVTLLSGPESLVRWFPGGEWYYRIFEQSQFIVMAFEVVLLVATCLLWRTQRIPKYVYGWHALMLSALVAGMSRSFWLGMATAGLAVIGALLLERLPVRAWVRAAAVGGVSMVAALALLWALIAVPVPTRPDLTASPFYRGGDDNTRDLAVSSRWNLLGPMMEQIGEAPLWGSGFGTRVTFVSDDPRVRAVNPSGEWTTYRFEWGFQDIWMKMGIPGLLAVAWYLGVVVFAAWRAVREKREWRWLSVGLAAAVIALFATHAFSPYLNHPIGLGFMLFVLPFLGWNRSTDVEAIGVEQANGQPVAVGTMGRPSIGVVTAEIESR